ncbi:MAG: UvrD-helicase domain-containing protein [Proteiniphilum sp.]|nr:UvrD-helicase domain-containing protein [Proteiniphilum sp.]
MIQLNEQQQKAAGYEGKHLLVLAGAGTGKTGTIIARAEYLLRKGVQPNRIAILSFTRKSAKEIAERLKISAPGGINKKEITGRTFHSWNVGYLLRKCYVLHNVDRDTVKYYTISHKQNQKKYIWAHSKFNIVKFDHFGRH